MCNAASIDILAASTTIAAYVRESGYGQTDNTKVLHSMLGSTPRGDEFQAIATESIARLSGTTFFVGYTCQQQNGNPMRDCKDAVCATPMLQL